LEVQLLPGARKLTGHRAPVAQLAEAAGISTKLRLSLHAQHCRLTPDQMTAGGASEVAGSTPADPSIVGS